MSSKSRVFKDIVSQTKWSGKNKLVLELNSYHLFDVEELIEYLRFNEFTESYFAARGLAKMSYELKIPALKASYFLINEWNNFYTTLFKL